MPADWLERIHAWFVAAFLVIGTAPLWLYEPLSPIIRVGFGLPVLVWVPVSMGLVEIQFSQLTESIAAILALVGAVLLRLFGGLSLLQSGAALLCAILVLRILSRRTLREDIQIYALTFIAFSVGTLFHDSIVFGFGFVSFSVVGTFLMAMYHFRLKLSEHSDSGRVTGSVRGIYTASVAAVSLLVIFGAFVFFAVLPRVGVGFFRPVSDPTESIPGFSEEVTLQTHGTDRDNPRVVMRVQFPGGRPPDTANIHWRVMAFNRFDGTRWHRDTPSDPAELADTSIPDDMPKSVLDPSLRKAVVSLRGLNTAYVPVVWPTAYVKPTDDKAPMLPAWHGYDLKDDSNGNLSRSDNDEESNFRYRLGWWREPPTRNESVKLDPSMRKRFTQMPDISERTKALAQRIVGDATDRREKVNRIVDYLSQNFEYSVSAPQNQTPKGLENFLFERKQAHCEYFATAAAVLLRIVDVPVRLVNGFLGGRWNGPGDYLVVRQGDAHSWIEVYLPTQGWRPFDPTPEGAIAPMEPPHWVEMFRNLYGAAQFYWHNWIIRYDLEHQADIIENVVQFFSLNAEVRDGDEDRASEDGGSVELPFEWLTLALWILLNGIWWTHRTRTTELGFRVGLSVGLGSLFAGWLVTFYEVTWATGSMSAGLLSLGYLGLYWLAGRLSLFRQSQLRRRFGRLRRLVRNRARHGDEKVTPEAPSDVFDALVRMYPSERRDIEYLRRVYLRCQFSDARPTTEILDRFDRVVTRLERRDR